MTRALAHLALGGLLLLACASIAAGLAESLGLVAIILGGRP